MLTDSCSVSFSFAGKGLPAMDFGGSSDPYVKLWLEPDEEKKIKQTSVQVRYTKISGTKAKAKMSFKGVLHL